MFKTILFICVGNICRSPVAEYWVRSELRKKNYKDIHVSSAGLSAMVAHPIAPEMQTILDRFEIDASAHRARQADEKIISQSEIIFTMESWQKEKLSFVFPSCRGKIFCLGKWRDEEITDPYHQAQNVFETVFESIKTNWDIWQKKLWNG